MNKRLILPLAALFCIIISFAGCVISRLPEITAGNGFETILPAEETPYMEQPGEEHPGADGPAFVITGVTGESREFRALWVASVLNLDFPSKPGIPAAAMKREIEAIVATAADIGLNAVIFQARPCGDAFYESSIFPWSAWLTGEQGRGIPGFDPLAYWIEVCHDYDIELHAWLNPYRIIHTSSNSSDPETLAINNPVRQNPALAVGWSSSDGRSGLFLNPGLPEARQLIIDGIIEIISNYDVDGIHFDDYFYPGMDFADDAAFEQYGGGLELAGWRRENVNTLIRDIQSAIRGHNTQNNKKVRWGISPSAIWKNGSSDPLGIPGTSGQESYHALYADTRLWVTEGWVDYICPQIYWYIGYDIADFEAVYAWWDDLCSQYGTDLYIGHAVYREFENNQPPNWQGEIVRQLEMISGSEAVKGSVFYRYLSLRSPAGDSIRDYYAEKDGFPPREPVMTLEKLSVGFPAADDTVTGTPSSVSGYNITGTSIPGKPLYLNGDEVTARTQEGFFHVFVPLGQGDNVFTFSQDDEEEETRVITLTSQVSGGMTPSPSPAPKITAVTALDYATVIADDAWVYPGNTTSGGSDFMLSIGQRDRIVARSDNNMLKLSSGVWVRSDAVTVERESSEIADVLKNGTYRSGTDFDIIAWESAVFPAVTAEFRNNKLTLRFGMHKDAPPLELPEFNAETLFESIRNGVSGGIPFYEFTLEGGKALEGFFIEYEDDELRVCLKKRKTLSETGVPLENITIVLDAGHGGDAPGAIGALGYGMPEKDFNLLHSLMLAERLQELGADVIMTRDYDADISLQERVNLSRQVKPDLFLSLHVNSVAETTDAGNIRGFTVWYKNENSAALTEVTGEIMQYINHRTNRQRVVNRENFFVCRPQWAPHILLEAGFVSNIDDFTWLIDPAQQERYTDAIADVILEYFS